MKVTVGSGGVRTHWLAPLWTCSLHEARHQLMMHLLTSARGNSCLPSWCWSDGTDVAFDVSFPERNPVPSPLGHCPVGPLPVAVALQPRGELFGSCNPTSSPWSAYHAQPPLHCSALFRWSGGRCWVRARPSGCPPTQLLSGAPCGVLQLELGELGLQSWCLVLGASVRIAALGVVLTLSLLWMAHSSPDSPWQQVVRVVSLVASLCGALPPLLSTLVLPSIP